MASNTIAHGTWARQLESRFNNQHQGTFGHRSWRIVVIASRFASWNASLRGVFLLPSNQGCAPVEVAQKLLTTVSDHRPRGVTGWRRPKKRKATRTSSILRY